MDEGGNSIAKLDLEGNLGIEKAASLRLRILEELRGGRTVEIDLSAVDDIDLSCLQVLYAARREAARLGGSFALRGVLSRRIVKRLKSSGFVLALPGTGGDLETTLVDFSVEGA